MNIEISAYLIIILSSIAVGMIIALIIRKRNIYYGPNAVEQIKKVFYNNKTKYCYKFNVKPLECPKPKTLLQKIIKL